MQWETMPAVGECVVQWGMVCDSGCLSPVLLLTQDLLSAEPRHLFLCHAWLVGTLPGLSGAVGPRSLTLACLAASSTVSLQGRLCCWGVPGIPTSCQDPCSSGQAEGQAWWVPA